MSFIEAKGCDVIVRRAQADLDVASTDGDGRQFAVGRKMKPAILSTKSAGTRTLSSQFAL